MKNIFKSILLPFLLLISFLSSNVYANAVRVQYIAGTAFLAKTGDQSYGWGGMYGVGYDATWQEQVGNYICIAVYNGTYTYDNYIFKVINNNPGTSYIHAWGPVWGLSFDYTGDIQYVEKSNITQSIDQNDLPLCPAFNG